MTRDAAAIGVPEMGVDPDPVREFYTRHPYPPPVTNLDRARDEWRDPNRHRAEYHLLWPDRPYRADLRILVAGCGTWQAAKYALCHPRASVVGIDVSPTSIDHTDALKRQYALANLEIHELPIERALELERRFDLIVCTGVLHHLAEPDAGLRALGSVLETGGAMSLMVYAPYGRTGVYLLQEYCRRLDIGTTDREIRDLIATLESLPQDHPLVSLLRGARDARNANALADALLNPRDRSYSVTRVFEFVERNGLRFGRWRCQAPYLPHCGAIAATPHAERLRRLPERDQYAALELWRGTMSSHSAIVYGADDGGTEGAVNRDDWRRFVPVRLPWTQLIEERLPPGAAGALVNRSHRCRDLVLVLDARERRLFDAIDAERGVAAIAEAARETPERARAFFETLWRYDQVVFDRSRSADR